MLKPEWDSFLTVLCHQADGHETRASFGVSIQCILRTDFLDDSNYLICGYVYYGQKITIVIIRVHILKLCMAH